MDSNYQTLGAFASRWWITVEQTRAKEARKRDSRFVLFLKARQEMFCWGFWQHFLQLTSASKLLEAKRSKTFQPSPLEPGE
ncbi:hypothetical protein PABG_12286 [Paracoccidioides brasiliensis Pb03]|nr:hypothetical protein PABG_12286 [Paracoccidioides brasiliensis Pb03]ODH53600.1 hypothetical protein GX48_00018 [Paracoccidioides brasiliensis]